MVTLETDRLDIRNFCADDWRDLLEMIVGYQASDVAQYDHEWPTSEREIEGVVEWFASEDRFLAVCLNTTHKLIGLIVLTPREKCDSNEFSLGYIYHSDYHGRGYATEGCRAVVDHTFALLAADRFSSSTAAANEPSCRLLRRLGFSQTGCGTSSFRKTLDGTPIEFDSLSFALTRDEWLALGQAPQ